MMIVNFKNNPNTAQEKMGRSVRRGPHGGVIPGWAVGKARSILRLRAGRGATEEKEDWYQNQDEHGSEEWSQCASTPAAPEPNQCQT